MLLISYCTLGVKDFLNVITSKIVLSRIVCGGFDRDCITFMFVSQKQDILLPAQASSYGD